MKKNFLLIGLVLAVSVVMAQGELNVMTFNIRYNTKTDSLNAWPYRKDKVASQVLFHQVDLLGVQEALQGQIKDLLQSLPSYKYIGVGRDDGKEKGEYSAIFYDSTRLHVIRWGTFWLSETPDVPGSKGWDAAFPRLVTWAKFSDLRTRSLFFAFNTHFDHIGKVARIESAGLLLNKVKEIAGDTTAIVSGDFNTKLGDGIIEKIIDPADPLHLTDTKSISIQPHYGPSGTFNGFGPVEKDDQPIDHIFIKGKASVLRHATISETWKGRYASDHFAVIAAVLLGGRRFEIQKGSPPAEKRVSSGLK